MEAYSLDLRERILQACEDGFDTRQEIAETHGVSLSFVHKLWRRWMRHETVAAKPRGKGPLPLLGEPRWTRVIRQIVTADADATLAELCAGLAQCGGPRVSRSTMCRTVGVMGLPLKKSRFTPASETRLA